MAARTMRVAAFPRRLATNPYCELLYDHVERLGVEVVEGRSGIRWLFRSRRRVRVLHLHWPERHFRSGSLPSAIGFALRLLAARLLGYRIVWTVHNAAPHEDASGGDRLVRAILRRLATLVVHCEAARRTLGPAGPRAHVIPHGSYVGRYPNGIGSRTARERLGVESDACVFLAFGQVRSYKGLDALLQAFSELPASHARLLIATTPLPEKQAVFELRGQLNKYHLGIHGAAAMRDRLVRAESLADIEAILRPVVESGERLILPA